MEIDLELFSKLVTIPVVSLQILLVVVTFLIRVSQ